MFDVVSLEIALLIHFLLKETNRQKYTNFLRNINIIE